MKNNNSIISVDNIWPVNQDGNQWLLHMVLQDLVLFFLCMASHSSQFENRQTAITETPGSHHSQMLQNAKMFFVLASDTDTGTGKSMMVT
jgi:hypothetical protein